MSKIQTAHPRSKTATQTVGFTLIEMMVVISIVGLLAAVVVGSLGESRSSAQYAVAESDFQLITEAVVLTGSPQSLTAITGNVCSMCACRDLPNSTDLGTLDESTNPAEQTCLNNWESAIDAIAANSIYLSNTNASQLYRDPWGSPYVLDENEGEFSANPCRADLIRTVGPDRTYGTSDDRTTLLPFRTLQCSNYN